MKPLSPIAESPKREIDSNVQFSQALKRPIQANNKVSSGIPKIRKVVHIPHEQYKIQTCNALFLYTRRTFCLDCFFMNFFGQGFYCDPQLLKTSEKFKNSHFPSFNKPKFDIFIEGTEIPLF